MVSISVKLFGSRLGPLVGTSVKLFVSRSGPYQFQLFESRLGPLAGISIKLFDPDQDLWSVSVSNCLNLD